MREVPLAGGSILCASATMWRFVLLLVALLCADMSFGQSINQDASQTTSGIAVEGFDKVRVGVTSSQFDDIPAVLKTLGIPFRFTRNSQTPLQDFDVIFIGCTTNAYLGSPQQLQAFVKQGKVLYVSDLSYTYISRAFPDKITWAANGRVGRIQCEVIDPNLQQAVGKNIMLNFNAPVWAYPVAMKPEVQALIKHNERPITVRFKYGKGQVIFTSFHKHANASDKENLLLSKIVIAPLKSAKLGIDKKKKTSGNVALGAAVIQDKSPQELFAALSNCDKQTQKVILRELQSRKGKDATQALVSAVGAVGADLRDEARRLLVKRLTRLKASTLKKYLKDSNPTLRLAAIGAAKNKQSRELALPLSALITDSDKKIGVAANRALQEITGQDFGSVVNASLVKRVGIRNRWKAWVEDQ